MITADCHECGVELIRRRGEDEDHWHRRKFCSRDCYYASLRHPLTSDEFWSRVNTDGDCWEWQGTRDAYGYGQVTVNRKKFKTHRIAVELASGPIPAGMAVCHRCDNPACVRPDHLFLGTHADNMADARRKGRMKPPPPQYGTANSRAKLTDDDVAEIRRRFVRGMRPEKGTGSSASELAREFGVTSRHIWDVANGNVRAAS